MRALLSGLGILSVLACIVGSMTMNYLYGASLGRTELESSVWGGLSIAFDALKAGQVDGNILPFGEFILEMIGAAGRTRP